jgi:hypothetical protein
MIVQMNRNDGRRVSRYKPTFSAQDDTARAERLPGDSLDQHSRAAWHRPQRLTWGDYIYFIITDFRVWHGLPIRASY